MDTTRTRRVGGIVAAAALAAGSLLGAGVPAHAAPAAQSAFIATPNGMVGVSQEITIKAPSAAGQTVTVGLTAGTVAQTLQTTIGSNGIGELQWTPGGAGPWTISGLGTIANVGSTTIQVAPMPTYSVILAPNHLQTGVQNTIEAAVVAPIGTLAPTGNVTVSVTNGQVLASAPLSGTFAPNISTASVPWTPTFTSPALPMVASYTPASGGQLASTSAPGQPVIDTGVQLITARWPSVMYVGTPTVLQAVIGPDQPYTGVASFTFSTGGGSGSIGTTNGVVSYQWTPTTVGVQNITVQFSGARVNSSPGQNQVSGSIVQSVNVLPARAADNLTVSAAGQGPWSIAQPIAMTAGASLALTGTSQSGTTVLFDENGPCVINGATLTALSAGQCQLTAFSPGNAQLTPGNEVYTITVNPAPKPKPKPRPNRNRR